MSDFARFATLHLKDMRAQWGLTVPYDTRFVLVGVTSDSGEESAAAHLSHEQFYELREAVNDLYDHIRQEQPSD